MYRSLVWGILPQHGRIKWNRKRTSELEAGVYVVVYENEGFQKLGASWAGGTWNLRLLAVCGLCWVSPSLWTLTCRKTLKRRPSLAPFVQLRSTSIVVGLVGAGQALFA